MTTYDQAAKHAALRAGTLLPPTGITPAYWTMIVAYLQRERPYACQ